MAIATERWTGVIAQRGADSSHAIRMWDVIDCDTEREAIEAPDIARRGDEHPRYGSSMLVRSITSRQLGPKVFEVSCNYDDEDRPGKRRPSRKEDEYENKLSRALRIHWSPILIDESIDVDIYGNKLMNSSHQTFSNAILETFATVQLQAIRYERSYDIQFALSMINSINSNQFSIERDAVIRPYQGKIISIAPTSAYEVNNTEPIEIRYVFEFRETGWQRLLLDEGTKKRIKVPADMGGGFSQMVMTSKKDGLPVSSPIKLDGTGQAYDQDYQVAGDESTFDVKGAEVVERASAFFLRYTTLKLRSWSVLGL